MGAIIGALIGKHMAHEEQRRQDARSMIIPALQKHTSDPANSTLTPDDADKLMRHAIQMKLVPKDYVHILTDDLKKAREKYDAAEYGRKLAADTASKTEPAQGMGVPSMNPAAAAPAMPEGPQFSPVSAPPPASGFGPVGQATPEKVSAMAQQLMPLLMAAKPQQGPAPGAAPPGPGPGVAAPGMPKMPFTDGAGAGPVAPPNPRPEMAKAAASGGLGFNVPPPAPAPVQMAQAQPPRLFPIQGRSQEERATTTALANQNAQIAASRVLMNFGEEKVNHALAMLERMGINKSQLTPTQVSSFMIDGKIPEVKVTDIAKEATAMWTGADGKQHFTFGQRPPVTTQPGATTRIMDNPNIQPGVEYSPSNPIPPMTGPPGEGMTVSGGLKISDAQRAANAAWEANHKMPITPDKFGEAKSEYDEASITKTARTMNDARIRNMNELRATRLLREQALQHTIMEWNQTKGPEAIDALADQVRQSPDFYAKLTGDVANLVGQRFTQKYHLPPPVPLPQVRRDQEDASIISINHAQAIRPYLSNPVVQKRLGAWNGRLGNLEQSIGDTKGLSPEDSRIIQDLRSRMSYFFAQESKSAFGGKTAKEFLEELQKTSPRMSSGLPLILGALDAAESMAKVNLESAQQYRFAQPPGTVISNQVAPPAAPPAANPMRNPPAGTPATSGKSYKFKNSKGDMVRTNVPDAELADFKLKHPDAKVE